MARALVRDQDLCAALRTHPLEYDDTCPFVRVEHLTTDIQGFVQAVEEYYLERDASEAVDATIRAQLQEDEQFEDEIMARGSELNDEAHDELHHAMEEQIQRRERAREQNRAELGLPMPLAALPPLPLPLPDDMMGDMTAMQPEFVAAPLPKLVRHEHRRIQRMRDDGIESEASARRACVVCNLAVDGPKVDALPRMAQAFMRLYTDRALYTNDEATYDEMARFWNERLVKELRRYGDHSVPPITASHVRIHIEQCSASNTIPMHKRQLRLLDIMTRVNQDCGLFVEKRLGGVHTGEFRLGRESAKMHMELMREQRRVLSEMLGHSGAGTTRRDARTASAATEKAPSSRALQRPATPGTHRQASHAAAAYQRTSGF